MTRFLNTWRHQWPACNDPATSGSFLTIQIHLPTSTFTNDPLLMFQKPLGHCPVQIKSPATRYARKQVQSRLGSGFRAGPCGFRSGFGNSAEMTGDPISFLPNWFAQTWIHQWPAFNVLVTCRLFFAVYTYKPTPAYINDPLLMS